MANHPARFALYALQVAARLPGPWSAQLVDLSADVVRAHHISQLWDDAYALEYLADFRTEHGAVLHGPDEQRLLLLRSWHLPVIVTALIPPEADPDRIGEMSEAYSGMALTMESDTDADSIVIGLLPRYQHALSRWYDEHQPELPRLHEHSAGRPPRARPSTSRAPARRRGPTAPALNVPAPQYMIVSSTEGMPMGTWGIDPFDSDSAGEFGDRVDAAPKKRRPLVIREVLTRLVETTDNPLYGDVVPEAIAAAALVATQCPAGQPPSSGYWPKQQLPPLPEDLPQLAARALDRVLTHATPLVAAWFDVHQGESWLEQTVRLRTTLDPQTPPVIAYDPASPGPDQPGARMLRDALGPDRLWTLRPGGPDALHSQLMQQLRQTARDLDRAHQGVLHAANQQHELLSSQIEALNLVSHIGAHKPWPSATRGGPGVSPVELGVQLGLRSANRARLLALIDLHRAAEARLRHGQRHAPDASATALGRTGAAASRSTTTLTVATAAPSPSEVVHQQPHLAASPKGARR